MAAPAAVMPATSQTATRGVRFYFPLFAMVLLLSMAVQFPVVYNFQFFAFYDPGTAFHGLALLDKGYRPTVDFGYTHGLLSLEFGRAWFGLLGRSPLAFVGAVVALQMVIAWGLARLAARFQLTRRATVLFCCMLPWAVIPDYLTLTHPLEAALLVHALADHAAGRRSRALSLLTLCLFVKPSMAYVYGFVLLLLVIRTRLWEEGAVRDRVRRLLRDLIPAAVVGVLSLALVLYRYGPVPVKNTLFAIAGVNAYKETNFGLFAGDGLSFWWPDQKTVTQWAADHVGLSRAPASLAFVTYYLLTPATLWIIATLTLLGAGLVAVIRFVRHSGVRASRPVPFEMLFTLALLHTVFLTLFYGWRLSWTYYAYMPFFAVAAIVPLVRLRRAGVAALCMLALLSHLAAMSTAFGGWFFTVRTRETSGLFAWDNHATSYREVLAQTGDKPTLLLTNGYPFYVPPNVSIPDAWFPEAGIATDAEVKRVRQQALASEYVIIFHPYGRADLWHTRQFADVRARFRPVVLQPAPKYGAKDADGNPNPYRNSHFELWEKIPDLDAVAPFRVTL